MTTSVCQILKPSSAVHSLATRSARVYDARLIELSCWQWCKQSLIMAGGPGRVRGGGGGRGYDLRMVGWSSSSFARSTVILSIILFILFILILFVYYFIVLCNLHSSISWPKLGLHSAQMQIANTKKFVCLYSKANTKTQRIRWFSLCLIVCLGCFITSLKKS